MPEVVIAPLHGIRTTASWQRTLSDAAQAKGWRCALEIWNYGRFSLLRFLMPWQRETKIRWFRKTYTAFMRDSAFNLNQNNLPSIVAHSFGTYILGYALLKYDNIRFDKVILCASILPRDFPWQDVLDRGQVTAVLNEYGSNDLLCRIAPWFIQGAGTSGQEGFWSRHNSLVQTEFHFTHREYFERGHIESHWFPFIEKKFEDTRQLVCLSVHRLRPNIPWALYFGYAMLLLAGGFFIPWPKFGPWSSAPISQVTPVMDASTETLQTQLRLTTQERDNVREQLEALERNLSELGAFTQRFGVIDLWSATNLYWGGKLLLQRLRKHSAALLITAPPEIQPFADYLISVIGAAAVILDTEHPEQKSTDPLTVQRPSDTDLDAPKIPLPDFNGVVVHSVGEIQNAVEGLLKRTKRCIIVRTTKKTIEGLAEYYKRDVIWVEVGKEPLWNNSPTCDR